MTALALVTYFLFNNNNNNNNFPRQSQQGPRTTVYIQYNSSIDVSLSLLLRFCHSSITICGEMRDALLVLFFLSVHFTLFSLHRVLSDGGKKILHSCVRCSIELHTKRVHLSVAKSTHFWCICMCYASIIIKLNPFRCNTLTPWLCFIGRPLDGSKTNNSTNEWLLFDTSMATHITINYIHITTDAIPWYSLIWFEIGVKLLKMDLLLYICVAVWLTNIHITFPI